MVPVQPGRPELLLLFCLAVGVAEAAPAPPTETPDAELLDFLGSWQDEGDGWVDLFTVTNDPVTQPPAEPSPSPSGKFVDARKPVKETPSTSTKDRPRDPRRIQTGP